MGRKANKSVVISVRLDEAAMTAVDLLVRAGLAQSRSEAASQFIRIGVQSSEQLILKAKALEEDVRKLKNEMLGAVKSKDLEKVAHLLHMDDGLKDAKAEDGQTAILMAAYYRANEMKELLLRKGAELNLYEAAAVGSTARVRQILSGSPKSIDTHSFDGYTPLGLAAYFGNGETAACLLDLGADVNLRSQDGKLNNTPLHAAIAGGHIDIAELLLNLGADVDVQCEGEIRAGFTPLHVAAHFNRLEITRLLLKRGANPRIPNSQSLTPGEYALKIGNREIAHLLNVAAPPDKKTI